MKIFIQSDIHIDFYSVQTSNYDTILPNFEDQYKRMFLPADALIMAGDAANDYQTQKMFYKFLGTKYNHVYIVFGNHDLVVSGATFGNGNPFKRSEEKIEAIKKEFKNDKHVHILDGDIVDNIGGCMGMCDLSYTAYPSLTKITKMLVWNRDWFDGRHWNYMNNDFDKIWKHYDNKMMDIVKQKPKVMVTHFCPLELGVKDIYKNDMATAFFYFEGHKYLDEMDNDSYWICGHTHTAYKKDYINSKGNTIHFICNPMGYPSEDPFEGIFKREDFLIEI